MEATDPANPSERRVFVARIAMLPETAAFAQQFCDRHGIAHPGAMRLMLILEELFTNTVKHGYGVDSEAPIRVTLTARGGGRVALLYEDAAREHDPLAGPAGVPRALMAAVDSRSIGGLGLHLVSRFAEHARYTRDGGWNRLQLSVAVDD